ncbi:16S rRNA (guanine(966)-N(2))-methyltransferase RsmD [Thaumasiovibrio subtropicus]|uniref:16S rRNA (guanine(966)-N(2))-methyltransferase RsmD n=1 Tax=Thaumasiovibrio subtropicus TaxID=1891207 RepID=UPI000B34ECB2|nr:16S rRNA (guanine(966)-N(2))-methyltransferase RsmD [Thaumasiovibrio subtropicus]
MSRRPSQSRRKPASKPTGFVRIISGKWRGRKLPVHDSEGLRPTTDRVKETLFNWLAADLHDARCLDLFSGSGSLGIEALSRFAAHVDLIELDKTASNQLKSNIDSLQDTSAQVHNTNALQYLDGPATPYDIVFIDPPFRQNLLPDCIEKLEQNGWLSPHAMIYIEAEKELGTPTVPAHWRLHREKHAGQLSYRLYEREAE